jgi:hypothetical protein
VGSEHGEMLLNEGMRSEDGNGDERNGGNNSTKNEWG